MPFESDAQRRYLWANNPELARKWSNEYGTTARQKKKKKKADMQRKALLRLMGKQ